MSFGSSGNGLYLEALQGSQPLIVGEHPWVTPIVSDSLDKHVLLVKGIYQNYTTLFLEGNLCIKYIRT